MNTMNLFHPSHIKRHVQHLRGRIKKVRFHFSQLKKKKRNIYMILIVVAIVLIRRGIRGLLDVYLLPNHPVWSMVLSITIGLLILYLDDREIDELVG